MPIDRNMRNAKVESVAKAGSLAMSHKHCVRVRVAPLPRFPRMPRKNSKPSKAEAAMTACLLKRGLVLTKADLEW